MSSTPMSLKDILAQPHPMAAYRAYLDSATAGGPIAEDDLAAFHQLQSRARAWCSLVSPVMDTTDHVLTKLDSILATLPESPDAPCPHTEASVAKLLTRVRQRNVQLVRDVDPQFAKRRSGTDGTHAPWCFSALHLPSVPSTADIDVYIKALTKIEKEHLVAGSVRVSLPSNPGPDTTGAAPADSLPLPASPAQHGAGAETLPRVIVEEVDADAAGAHPTAEWRHAHDQHGSHAGSGGYTFSGTDTATPALPQTFAKPRVDVRAAYAPEGGATTFTLSLMPEQQEDDTVEPVLTQRHPFELWQEAHDQHERDTGVSVDYNAGTGGDAYSFSGTDTTPALSQTFRKPHVEGAWAAAPPLPDRQATVRPTSSASSAASSDRPAAYAPEDGAAPATTFTLSPMPEQQEDDAVEPVPAQRHPFELWQEAHDQHERGTGASVDFTGGSDGYTLFGAGHTAPALAQTFPKPIVDVEWATAPPLPDDPRPVDAVTLVPQSGAPAMPTDTSDFSAFSKARLPSAGAHAMADVAVALRASNSTSLAAGARIALKASSPERGAAAHVSRATLPPETPATTTTVTTATVEPSPEMSLQARARDVLVAEQVYAQAANDAITVAVEATHASARSSAQRDCLTIEQLQVMVYEAQSLLQTMQAVQLQCWRESLSSAACNPSQTITSPRFALCCSACGVAFGTTVIRTKCRRCGQFCCPDCVRDYGIGPEVACTDAQGNRQYLSLGWEPICVPCYRHCAAYALQVLQQSQPLLLTSSAPLSEGTPTPATTAASPPVRITTTADEHAVQARLRLGAAGGVPLKHLVLHGGAGTDALPSLSRNGGPDVLAADGLPPFYVYVSGDRSMSVSDRVGYVSVRSAGTWKSAVKGTGTLVGNLYSRMKQSFGSYRYGPAKRST